MQTFLPLPEFRLSVKALDWRRLGKQRVEAYQLLLVNLPLRFPGVFKTTTNAWANHPAARMWRGHETHLVTYALFACEEWLRRGYKDNLTQKLHFIQEQLQVNDRLPSWFGNDAFHSSHRSNLLRKDPDWYGQFNWPEPPTLPYVWPT